MNRAAKLTRKPITGARQSRQQPDLFAGTTAKPRALEVHSHVFVSGPRANGMFIRSEQKTTSEFSHSHEGGDVPHSHPDTGPACYTIDKDDWMRATGMRGGGRKKFTDNPTGLQLPIVELEKWQTEFEIHISDPPPDFEGQGAGIAPAARMCLAFGMKVASITDTRGKS
mgnify:CR=1 FL=1